MTRRRRSTAWMVGLLALLALAVAFSSCAAKKPPWGDPQSGLILSYRMAEDQALEYEMSFSQKQIMQVQGQSVEVDTDRSSRFTLSRLGQQDDDHRLTVTIDSMEMNIKGPQGEMSPDMSGVNGKSFEMTLSTLGKEQDMSGAEAIQYDLGQGGKRNVSIDFQGMFPDLAGRPVKIGDTWTATDTLHDKTDRADVQVVLEAVNKLDGFETVDGKQCVRIVATVTGKLSGQGSEGGMELDFVGTMTGTETWFFAYEEGVFVKSLTEISTDATITTKGAQSMTIPVTQELTIEGKLIES